MPVKPYERGVAGKKLPGMKLLQNNSKLKPYNMSYNKGKTLIRPWGTINPDGSMVGWRDQENHFGTSWFVQDMVCMGWGKDMRFTAFLEVEDPDNWTGGSPLQVFMDDMRSHAEFKPILFEKPTNSFAPIDNPKACGFLKGVLIENAGKKYHNSPIWGAMLILASSARESFDELVNRELSTADAATGNTDDDPHGWNSRYVVGDPIGFETGKVFEFDKESNFSSVTSASGINLAADGNNKSTSGDVIEKYACRMWPDGEVLSIEEHKDKVSRYDQSFEDALRFMTGEEQINELIVPGYGRSCREAVLYSFGGKGVLPPSFETGRTTVDMGKEAAEPKGEQPRQAAQASMSSQRRDASTSVNLGGGDDLPTQDPPFDTDEQPADDDSQSDPVDQEAPAENTAAAIRERLAGARK
jgi:hypothetical protein